MGSRKNKTKHRTLWGSTSLLLLLRLLLQLVLLLLLPPLRFAAVTLHQHMLNAICTHMHCLCCRQSSSALLHLLLDFVLLLQNVAHIAGPGSPGTTVVLANAHSRLIALAQLQQERTARSTTVSALSSSRRSVCT